MSKLGTLIFVLALPCAYPLSAQGTGGLPRTQTATVVEQQDIELAVARNLAPQIAVGFARALSNAALDARLFVNLLDSQNGLMALQRGEKVAADTSFNTNSHTPAHLEQLAGTLGLAATVNDSNSACVGAAPILCRMGTYAALFAFSPGSVQGDSAFIALKGAHPKLGQPAVAGGQSAASRASAASTFHLAVYRVTLVRSADGWKVVRVGMVAVN